MESLKKMFFKNELSIDDLAYLSKLLDTNMSLNNCLTLLSNKNNAEIFKTISTKLNEGMMIENIIQEFLPKQIKIYMIPLLKNISFSKALSLSLEFYDRNTKTENDVISSIAYPCFLLFITITALYLFDLYGIDTIFNLIKSFNTDLRLFESVRVVFRIFINIFYYGILLIILVLIVFLNPKRISLLYIFMCKYFPNSLINLHYSQEFISLLLICANRGYKTKDALQILKQMKSKPIISFLAFHLDEALLEGESLKEAASKMYYDISLSRFIKIANYTNDFSGILSSYTSLVNEKIKRKLKKYTSTIQVFTYGFIGLIIVFIYEILFLPMQAITAY